MYVFTKKHMNTQEKKLDISPFIYVMIMIIVFGACILQ